MSIKPADKTNNKVEDASPKTDNKEKNNKNERTDKSLNNDNSVVIKDEMHKKENEAAKKHDKNDGKENNDNKESKENLKDGKENKEGKDSKDGKTKSNYDNFTKEELIHKLKDFEEKLKLETEDKKKISEKKKEELDAKDLVIMSISKTNKKLIGDLAVLKMEVDQKLDKVSIKQIQKIEKMNEEKQNPLEIVLKVKERQLKNAHVLMDIIKRDKEMIQKTLDEKSEYKKVISLEDSLLDEKKKNQNLAMEIKLLQKMLETHNLKCLAKNNSQNEREKNFRDDLKLLKDKNKELCQRLKDEENKSNELSLKYYELQKLYDKTKHFIPKEDEEKIKKNLFTNSIIKKQIDKSMDKSFDDQRMLTSPSKTYKLAKIKTKKLYQDENKRLFSSQEISKLEQIMSKSELEKLEKKYDICDHKSAALEKKYNTELKIYTKKCNDLEQQLEFVTLQLKESEHRAKIYQFQVNEHKVENKSNNKKSNDLQSNLDIMKKVLSEKENDNKALLSRIQEYQKQNEVLKKKNLELERIKNDYMKTSGGDEMGEGNAQEGDEEEGAHRNIKPQKNKGLDNDEDIDD